MKTSYFVLFVLVVCSGFPVYSQEMSAKEKKEADKKAAQEQVEAVLNAREYVFTGTTAYPTGYRSVNLTTRQNFVKFHPDKVESDMPYFGKAGSSAAYSSHSDGGLKFEGKPEDYTFAKKKKNYLVDMVVREAGESYHITLTVQFSGSTTMTIISNDRSPISYDGYLSAPVAK
jgi:hypothetical protein